MKKTIYTSFNKFKNIRKELLSQHSETDHVFFQGNNSFLISAPHGVPQIRLGKLKLAEIGTIPMAVLLSKHTDSHLLIKTQNNHDDANFDKDCNYRNTLAQIIKTHNITHLIDIHGLAKFRPCDINLGSNFEQNTKTNPQLLDGLKSTLETAGFFVSIDEPFCAGPHTIAGYFAKKYNIWTIQIEVNCDITNNPQNISKLNKLINAIVDWQKHN